MFRKVVTTIKCTKGHVFNNVRLDPIPVAGCPKEGCNGVIMIYPARQKSVTRRVTEIKRGNKYA